MPRGSIQIKGRNTPQAITPPLRIERVKHGSVATEKVPMLIACVSLLILVAATGQNVPRAGEPLYSASPEPVWNADRSTWRHTISSSFQQEPNPIEVLLPDSYDPSRKYRVLYVLPVEIGIGGRWGDGLAEMRRIDVPDRFDLVCVMPAFDAVPWYMDHAEDPLKRHESYMMHVVVPFVEATYSTLGTKEGRLLIGFSKSGWGAFTLLLRNPTFFAAAASWDAPLMLLEKDWQTFGIGSAAGTLDQFKAYQPQKLLRARAACFQEGNVRFVLLGHQAFGESPGPAYAGAHAHTRWAHETMLSLGIKHVYSDDLVVEHAWESGWVKAAVAALMYVIRETATAPD